MEFIIFTLVQAVWFGAISWKFYVVKTRGFGEIKAKMVSPDFGNSVRYQYRRTLPRYEKALDFIERSMKRVLKWDIS